MDGLLTEMKTARIPETNGGQNLFFLDLQAVGLLHDSFLLELNFALHS